MCDRNRNGLRQKENSPICIKMSILIPHLFQCGGPALGTSGKEFKQCFPCVMETCRNGVSWKENRPICIKCLQPTRVNACFSVVDLHWGQVRVLFPVCSGNRNGLRQKEIRPICIRRLQPAFFQCGGPALGGEGRHDQWSHDEGVRAQGDQEVPGHDHHRRAQLHLSRLRQVRVQTVVYIYTGASRLIWKKTRKKQLHPPRLWLVRDFTSVLWMCWCRNPTQFGHPKYRWVPVYRKSDSFLWNANLPT